MATPTTKEGMLLALDALKKWLENEPDLGYVSIGLEFSRLYLSKELDGKHIQEPELINFVMTEQSAASCPNGILEITNCYSYHQEFKGTLEKPGDDPEPTNPPRKPALRVIK